jgi:hypothetical protein
MSEQRFPAGWDEQRVRSLLAELDARTEEEWVAADEAAAADSDDQAVVTVPATLLPELRRPTGSAQTRLARTEAGKVYADGGLPRRDDSSRVHERILPRMLSGKRIFEIQ